VGPPHWPSILRYIIKDRLQRTLSRLPRGALPRAYELRTTAGGTCAVHRTGKAVGRGGKTVRGRRGRRISPRKVQREMASFPRERTSIGVGGEYRRMLDTPRKSRESTGSECAIRPCRDRHASQATVSGATVSSDWMTWDAKRCLMSNSYLSSASQKERKGGQGHILTIPSGCP